MAHVDRLRRLDAVAANLHRMLDGSDLRQAARRLAEWADGVASPSGAGRSTETPRPTESRALTDPDLSYAGHTHLEVVDRAGYWMHLLERVVQDATRPTNASEEELRATEYVSEARARGKSSGVCEACDRECTGADNDRLVQVAGFGLCNTHYKAARRDRAKGVDVADYVRTTRARLGLDL